MNVSLTLQKAAKGNGKAMRLLYNEFKNGAYFFCKFLIGEDKAAETVRKVFADTWKIVMSATGDTRSFENILQANLVKHCKNSIIEAGDPEHCIDVKEEPIITALSRLPNKQKISMTLIYIYGTNTKAIASMFKMSESALLDTVKSGRENIAGKLAESLPDESKDNIDILLAKAGETVRKAAKIEKVPESVDEAVYADIETKSVNQQLTVKQKIIATVCAVFIIGAFIAMLLPKNDNKKHHVEIEIESYGTICVELDAGEAPITVENFIKLAKDGFYDGLTIHRVVPGFVIQGGDPEGTGRGGSEETIKGEFAVNGIENNILHKRGVISMARSSLSYDSASSQFFIVQNDAANLDGSYAAFGHVTSGMEIVDAICEDTPVQDTLTGYVAPENQPVIKEVRVID